jgi:predicted GIY-YIG superfamily endonuclease
MEYKIYCITDVNGIQYVGQTKQTVKKRLCEHRKDKKRGKTCSSRLLNLDDCMINILEECYNKWDADEAEKKWIKKIDCVNKNKYDFNRQEYMKEYNKKNKETKSEYDKKRSEYQKSWGGDRKYNNNLLAIDPDILNSTI